MIFERLRRWLARPPLRERVLTVLADAREPLPGLEIARQADTWGGPYVLLRDLEAEGLVESRQAPELAVQGAVRVYHRRVYWLTGKGRRARVGDPSGRELEAS